MHDEDLAAALRALGHPARLNILRILAGARNQCCCADVLQHLPLAQSTVSQHIKVLLDAGLIERRAQGTRNCYTVRLERIRELGAACAGLVADLLAVPIPQVAEPA